jgi:hypothetical protein
MCLLQHLTGGRLHLCIQSSYVSHSLFICPSHFFQTFMIIECWICFHVQEILPQIPQHRCCICKQQQGTLRKPPSRHTSLSQAMSRFSITCTPVFRCTFTLSATWITLHCVRKCFSRDCYRTQAFPHRGLPVLSLPQSPSSQAPRSHGHHLHLQGGQCTSAWEDSPTAR